MNKTSKNDSTLLADYLLYMEHNLGRSVRTVENYRLHLRRLITYLQTQRSALIKAKRSQLETFVGIEAHNSGYTVNGRRPIVAAVRSFYGWCQRQEHIENNPAESLPYPRPVKTLPLPISPGNAEKLLNSIKLETFRDVRDAAIIALFLASGLRLSGLRNLNQSNLFEMEVDGLDRLFLRVIEKRKKERIVPVPDVMKLLIIAYLNHPEYQSAPITTETGEKVLFINTRNYRVSPDQHYGEKRRLSVRYIEKMIHKRGELAGVPADQLRPHAIRHLYGTELAESGVDLHRIQLLLGHADMRTTTQYIHLAQRELFRVVNESSPLAKMNTPMHALKQHLDTEANKSRSKRLKSA